MIRSRLALFLLALVAVLVAPAMAAAETFVVNVPNNVVPDVGKLWGSGKGKSYLAQP